jgi:hypothetical protein
MSAVMVVNLGHRAMLIMALVVLASLIPLTTAQSLVVPQIWRVCKMFYY